MANSPLYNTAEYDAFKKAFGYNVRLARKARGLTIGQMCYLTGYRKDKYEMIEMGRKHPFLRKAYLIAAALGMRLSDLIPKTSLRTPAPVKKKVLYLRGICGSTRVVSHLFPRKKKKRAKTKKKTVEKVSRIRSRSEAMREKSAPMKA